MYIVQSLCTQAEPSEPEKVNKLLDILLRRDDRMLSRFCDILRTDRQMNIVNMFRRNGL